MESAPDATVRSRASWQRPLRRGVRAVAARVRRARPTVAVVVVHDGSRAAQQSLDSAVRQRLPGLQVVVVGEAPAREGDPRVRWVDPDGARGLAQARERGRAHVLAPWTLVLPSGQLLLPDAVARMWEARGRRSDLVVGDAAAWRGESVLTRPLLGRLLVRTAAWVGVDDHGDADGAVAALSLLATTRPPRTTGATVTESAPVLPRTFGQPSDPWPDLPARLALDRDLLERADRLAADGAAHRARGALGREVVPYLLAAELAAEPAWAQLTAHLRELLAAAGSLDDLPVQQRAMVWAAVHRDREELVHLVASRRAASWAVATHVDAGEVLADLELDDLPRDVRRLGAGETRLRTQLRRSRVVDRALEVELFCALEQVDQGLAVPRVRARLVGRGTSLPLEARVRRDPAVTVWMAERHQRHDGGVVTLSIPLEALPDGDHALEVEVEHAGLTRSGTVEDVASSGSAAQPVVALGRTVRWEAAEDRAACLRLGPADPAGPVVPVVDEVTVLTATTQEGCAQLTLTAPPGVTLWWEGPRARLLGQAHREGWRFALTASSWGRPEAAAPPGVYRLTAQLHGSGVPVRLAGPLLSRLPDATLTHHHRVAWERGPKGGLLLRLAAPLGPDELGPWAQHRLQVEHRATATSATDPDLVYFQSFSGAWPTDHPAALHEALLRAGPRSGTRIVWGVADHSVLAPAGARAVLLRSREWYDALATAGHVVTNIELPPWFRRRDDQQVLATYHGHPSKLMGLSQWRAQGLTPAEQVRMLRRTSGAWNTLLAPAPEMERYYRENYDFDGPIISEGYPRDDALVGPRREQDRDRTRRQLGVGPGQQVLLYAPTWRDDHATDHRRADALLHLDLEATAAELGPSWVLLVRGHRFHPALREQEHRGARVVDVTSHPEVNDLVLASDVAVLDYSSLRFDYALTAKPMIFLVPDLEAYTSRTRGFLFDFAESAPGPTATTTAEVLEHLRDLDRLRTVWGPRLASFNARFNYLADGHAADRVAATFFSRLLS